jgi:transcriptional regulator with PAS, ATPase and Fis domain
MVQEKPIRWGPLELVVFFWARAPERFPLPRKGQVTIGRDRETNQIAIPDSSVSRQHAILHVDTTIRIQDLGSSNGTFIRKGDQEMDSTTTQQEQRYCGQTFAAEVGDRISFGSMTSILSKARAEPEVRSSGSDVLPRVPIIRDVAMKMLHAEAREIAKMTPKACVLILGDSGVGKEVIARAIHASSTRAHREFVTVNCANMSESMFEREMFGHKRGAFTGATSDEPGHFDIAHGGTLLLDEIGELPLNLQAKLLRVVEDRRIYRVGDPRPKPIDVRIIAATNRRLNERIEEGLFRSDLYYRLCQFVLDVPPLKSRPSEIIPLAEELVAHHCQEIGQSHQPTLSPDTIAILEAYDYPGNVRDLSNSMFYAVAHCRSTVILPEHLPGYLQRRKQPPAPTVNPIETPTIVSERDRIHQVLNDCAGNQRRAAAQLGISLRTLQTRLNEYSDIPRPRKKKESAHS